MDPRSSRPPGSTGQTGCDMNRPIARMSVRQAELVVALRDAIGEGDGERSGRHVRELLDAKRESPSCSDFIHRHRRMEHIVPL